MAPRALAGRSSRPTRSRGRWRRASSPRRSGAASSGRACAPTSPRSPTAARARWTCCSSGSAGELLTVRRERSRSAARSTRSFALLAATGDTALVEVAQASGLALVAPAERDAEAASSAGTGELVAAAIDAGAAACSWRPAAARRPTAGSARSTAIEAAGGLRGARIDVLCDVRTPFERAAATFAPQKGADAAAVARLAGTARGVRPAARRADDRRRRRARGRAVGAPGRGARRRARRSCSTRSTSTAG